MTTRHNIFLVGPMGSGKTAVGRALARRLHWDFRDSDAEVESRTGVDVPYVFEKEGESGFRQRESAALERLTRLAPVVLATGGGAILNADNRRLLVERGRVVYLETSVQQQLERTRLSQTRPLLQHPNPAQRLQELMQIREPLYRQIAHVTVQTDARRVAAVVEEILRLLQGQ